MADVDATLLMQRVSKRLDELEGSDFGGGGARGGSSGGGIEARIARLEAHLEHMQDDVKEIKGELKTLLWAGITGFAVTWGGIIGLALLAAKGFGWIK